MKIKEKQKLTKKWFMKLQNTICDNVEQLEKELHGMRFRSLVDGLQNPCRIREIRREVARIKTILNERKQGIRDQASR